MTDFSGSSRHNLRRPLIVALCLWILFASPAPAYAYIDPGSGSMMLQLLLGGMAGVLVLIRLSWRRFAERARTLIGRSPRSAE